MIGLIQRVSNASCVSDGVLTGTIAAGLVILVCAEKNDDENSVKGLVDKILNYRIFSDENDKMNLSALDVSADLLVVSQFTLAADTNSGKRPSFSPAADPELGKKLYLDFVSLLKTSGLKVQTGVFGAHMQVSLVNDGPVTFWLQYPKKR